MFFSQPNRLQENRFWSAKKFKWNRDREVTRSSRTRYSCFSTSSAPPGLRDPSICIAITHEKVARFLSHLPFTVFSDSSVHEISTFVLCAYFSASSSSPSGLCWFSLVRRTNFHSQKYRCSVPLFPIERFENVRHCADSIAAVLCVIVKEFVNMRLLFSSLRFCKIFIKSML